MGTDRKVTDWGRTSNHSGHTLPTSLSRNSALGQVSSKNPTGNLACTRIGRCSAIGHDDEVVEGVSILVTL